MAKSKSEEVPMFNNIKEVLYNSVKLYGNNIAFTIKNKVNDQIEYVNKTYADFLEDVNSFGAVLYSLNLKESRIAILGRNRYEWAVAYLTNLLGGMVSVPLDKDLQVEELEESLIRSRAKAIVFDGKYKDMIENIKDTGKTFVEIFICMDEVKNFLYMNTLFEKENEYIQNEHVKKEQVQNKQTQNEQTQNEKTQNEKTQNEKTQTNQIQNEQTLNKQKFINHNVDSKQMSVLLFTSGTTSKSKAVMLNQEGIAVNIHDMLKVEGFKSTDVNIAFLPFHHIFGSTGLLVMLASGIKTVFADGLRYIKENLVEYKVSVFVGVPILVDKMYQAIVKAIKNRGKEKIVEKGKKISEVLLKFGIDVRRKIFNQILQELGGDLRLIISGGAPLDRETAINFNSFGIDVVQGYGLTETSPVIAAEDVIHKKPGSIGVPMENVELEIVNKDESGIGEIKVRGPNVMLGYYENEEATNEVLKDGWFYTGDLAYMDDDGYIFITGRKKDVIVLKNGKKIFPDELEFLINKIPEVEEVFVYGRPSEEDANDLTVSAKVVYNQEFVKNEYGDNLKEDLYNIIWNKIKEVNKTLPKYKYIKNLILTNIPLIKTTTNKVKRAEELKLILNE